MQKLTLQDTIKKLLVSGKGILAADESTDSIAKRFEAVGIPEDEEMREAYRELLFGAEGVANYITGVILYDETLRQSNADGVPLRTMLKKQKIVVGCKVDQGLKPLPGSESEMITRGLEGLADRLSDYFALGVRFAKWRAVFTIGHGLPSEQCIQKNVQILTAYAKICHEVSIVPILEPEVLMTGKHTQEQCFAVTQKVQHELFQELKKQGVDLRFVLLKPNMIVPGSESGEAMVPEKVANLTVSCLRSTVPPEVPGVVFLSGGQSDRDACLNLNAIAQHKNLPWVVTYSYSRALQNAALREWGGSAEHVAKAQSIFIERSRMASLAQQGKYNIELDR